MNTTFYKYQGTGNDFVMIDNRLTIFNKNNTKHIADYVTDVLALVLMDLFY